MRGFSEVRSLLESFPFVSGEIRTNAVTEHAANKTAALERGTQRFIFFFSACFSSKRERIIFDVVLISREEVSSLNFCSISFIF